jgi:hypothetical protein
MAYDIPNRVAEDINDAVESCIDNGVPVELFLRYARQFWHEYMQEKRNSDDRAFNRAHL